MRGSRRPRSSRRRESARCTSRCAFRRISCPGSSASISAFVGPAKAPGAPLRGSPTPTPGLRLLASGSNVMSSRTPRRPAPARSSRRARRRGSRADPSVRSHPWQALTPATPCRVRRLAANRLGTALVAPLERDPWSLDPGDGSAPRSYADSTGVVSLSSMGTSTACDGTFPTIAVIVGRSRSPHSKPDNDKSWSSLSSLIKSA